MKVIECENGTLRISIRRPAVEQKWDGGGARLTLFRKLVILFSVVILGTLSATLTIVYFKSRQSIIDLSKEKAVSIVQTIDSALLSDVPDYQFESVLLNLKRQNPDLVSFDIYKLNDFLYDIASTDPRRIGSQASPSSTIALGERKVLTSLEGSTIDLVVPLTGYAGMQYSANVRLSIAADLASLKGLLTDILVAGACALLVAVACAWLFTRQVLSKPLQSMMDAANEIAAGNFSVTLDASRRRDELGSLARGFERMARSLQQLIAQMGETAEELYSDFKQLIENGDYTAHGALHMADVLQHVRDGIDRVMASVRQLDGQMAEATAATSETRRSRTSEPDFEPMRRTLSRLIEDLTQVMRDLDGLSTTARGQLSAVQQVNRTAGRLSERASELHQLMASFEV